MIGIYRNGIILSVVVVIIIIIIIIYDVSLDQSISSR